MKLLSFYIFNIFLINREAYADVVGFPKVWEQINSQSAVQEASRLQTQSMLEGQKRAARHWYPKLYLDAKTYRTNDPGASFFGLLQQRSLLQSDFNPDSINQPNDQVYTRGALGLDLPLYEGGMKSALSDTLKYSASAQEKQTTQMQIDQYAMVGSSYGSMAVVQLQKQKLMDLESELTRLIKTYQLGSKSNPVGYSGLLGMKSLANRLRGLLSQYEAQYQAHQSLLKELGFKSQNWSPEAKNAKLFVTAFLNPQSDENEVSYTVEAARDQAKAGAQAAKMEKARFLPRVGAFAESYMFNGKRDTANGYSAGLYLQWSLLNASDIGASKEAQLKAQSAEKSALALEQQQNAEKASLKESLKALTGNLDLLEDSYKMLSEQSKMTGTLFKNGSINALQMVEILNRRTDLIQQQTDAELGLIKTAAQIVSKEKFDIVKSMNAGVSHGQ